MTPYSTLATHRDDETHCQTHTNTDPEPDDPPIKLKTVSGKQTQRRVLVDCRPHPGAVAHAIADQFPGQTGHGSSAQEIAVLPQGHQRVCRGAVGGHHLELGPSHREVVRLLGQPETDRYVRVEDLLLVQQDFLHVLAGAQDDVVVDRHVVSAAVGGFRKALDLQEDVHPVECRDFNHDVYQEVIDYTALLSTDVSEFCTTPLLLCPHSLL